MIHIAYFTGYSEDDCLDKLNSTLKQEQVINIIPEEPKEYEGYDEYDRWTVHSLQVFYKDLE